MPKTMIRNVFGRKNMRIKVKNFPKKYIFLWNNLHFSVITQMFISLNGCLLYTSTLGTVADYMKAETAFFTKVKNGIIDEVYCWSNKDDFDINAAENRPVKVVIPGFNGDGTSMKFGKKLYNLRDCGLPYDYYIDSYIVTLSLIHI